MLYGQKRVNEHAQNTQIQIHPTHVQSLIRTFALLIDEFYSDQIILLADSEGPDQTARMRRFTFALVVLIYPDTSSQGRAHM